LEADLDFSRLQDSPKPAGSTAGFELASAMTELEKDLLAGLVELENTVKSIGAKGSKPNLLPLFERLDRLTSQLPKGSDPNLLHYLHKKSYEKARLLLQGRDAENARGACR
jgi:hypothetical protein